MSNRSLVGRLFAASWSGVDSVRKILHLILLLFIFLLVFSAMQDTPLVLPEDSPVYTPPPEGFDRRSLEIYLLDEDPRTCWADLFAPFAGAQSAAGMGELGFVGGFIPTIPGSDRYVDEL